LGHRLSLFTSKTVFRLGGGHVPGSDELEHSSHLSVWAWPRRRLRSVVEPRHRRGRPFTVSLGRASGVGRYTSPPWPASESSCPYASARAGEPAILGACAAKE